MSKEEVYISLFEYLGKSAGEGSLDVWKEADKRGIKLKKMTLPEEKQTNDYRFVVTYPISFLNEYFKPEDSTFITREEFTTFVNLYQNQINSLTEKIENIESKLKTLNIEEDEYPL